MFRTPRSSMQARQAKGRAGASNATGGSPLSSTARRGRGAAAVLVVLLAGTVTGATAMPDVANAVDPGKPDGRAKSAQSEGVLRVHSPKTPPDDRRGDARVCDFYVAAFDFAADQRVAWQITESGGGAAVRSGTLSIGADGRAQDTVSRLPDGDYQLSSDATGSSDRETFTVDCPEPDGAPGDQPPGGGGGDDARPGGGSGGHGDAGDAGDAGGAGGGTAGGHRGGSRPGGGGGGEDRGGYGVGPARGGGAPDGYQSDDALDEVGGAVPDRHAGAPDPGREPGGADGPAPGTGVAPGPAGPGQGPLGSDASTATISMADRGLMAVGAVAFGLIALGAFVLSRRSGAGAAVAALTVGTGRHRARAAIGSGTRPAAPRAITAGSAAGTGKGATTAGSAPAGSEAPRDRAETNLFQPPPRLPRREPRGKGDDRPSR